MACKECSRHNAYVGKLLDGGEFELDVEFVAGVAIGAVAASKADMLLDKVSYLKENKMLKSGTKLAIGIVLTQTSQKVIEGAGYGMIAVGASEIVNSLMDKAAGIGGDEDLDRGGAGTQNLVLMPPGYMNGIPMKEAPGTENANIYGQEKILVNYL